MPRDAHDAPWRLLSHVCDKLTEHVENELALICPPGLNLTAPTRAAYYVLPTEAAVRRHVGKNHPEIVYIHPSSFIERNPRTVGTNQKSVPQAWDISIAFRSLYEGGADTYQPCWKDEADPEEREYLRMLVLSGAIQNIMDSRIRGPLPSADNAVMNAEFIDSEPGADRYKLNPLDPGTWGVQRWRMTQVVTVPLQTQT